MQIEIRNGQMVALAETVTEVKLLLGLSPAAPTYCQQCEREFDSPKGLQVHTTKMHGGNILRRHMPKAKMRELVHA